MSSVRNFLFIMCDQLRADHLSCYGHPHLQTPAVDQLARRGVLFERAFVQSGVCGPSRMSFYTGRYVSSHRATWNRVPLPLDEWLLGDYLDGLDHELVLFGKTHWLPDEQGLARLGTAQAPGQPARQGGFVELARHDGHHAEPDGPYGVKGVGEPPMVVSPAAIVSALRDATGRELTRVPVRPDDIVGL